MVYSWEVWTNFKGKLLDEIKKRILEQGLNTFHFYYLRENSGCSEGEFLCSLKKLQEQGHCQLYVRTTSDGCARNNMVPLTEYEIEFLPVDKIIVSPICEA